jgi:hypothetical protein
VIRVRRSSDNVEQDFYGSGASGIVSPDAIRSFNGWNLLAYTEDLNNAYWSQTGVTISAAPEPPVGISDASVMMETTANSAHRIAKGLVGSTVVGVTYCYTVVAKANGRDEILLEAISGATDLFGYMSLTNGTKRSGAAAVTSTSLGNGYWRFSFNFVAQSTTTTVYLFISNGSGVTYTGDNTKGVIATALQLEVASAFSTYEPRTTTGAGSSFLVTRYDQMSAGWNLLNKSEEFTNSAWSKTECTVSDSVVTAPIGTSTADYLVPSTNSSNSHRITQTVATPETPHTLSVYLKGDGTYNAAIISVAGTVYAIDLTNGTTNGGTAASLPNGWYRFSFSLTAPASSTVRIWAFDTYANASSATAFAGNGINGIYVAAAQYESGSVATAYERRSAFGAGQGHATQATTTLQPIVCESGVPVTNSGGRLTSKHVAADARRLAVANSTALYNFLHTTGGTVLAVHQSNDTAATKTVLANRSNNATPGLNFNRTSTEGYNAVTSRLDVAGVATSGNSVNTTNTATTTTNAIAVLQIDPDNATAASRSSLWENGTLLSGSNAETGIPFVENAGGNMTIGAIPAASTAFDGTIGDIGIWDVFFTEAERKLVEADQGRFNTITVAP